MALNINDRKFKEAGYVFHLSLIRQYSHSSKKTFCVGVSNRNNISYGIFFLRFLREDI